jgi:hypothetical protein
MLSITADTGRFLRGGRSDRAADSGRCNGRRSRTGEAHRSNDDSGKRWREEDLPALGWRYRELYATKSTFGAVELRRNTRTC